MGQGLSLSARNGNRRRDRVRWHAGLTPADRRVCDRRPSIPRLTQLAQRTSRRHFRRHRDRKMHSLAAVWQNPASICNRA